MTQKNDYLPSGLLTTVFKWTGLLGAILTAGSLIFWSWKITFGVAAGAIVVMVNLAGAYWILSTYFRARKKGLSGTIYPILYILKFFTIIGVVFFLVTAGLVNPVAFVVGIATLVVALVATVMTKGKNLMAKSE